MSELKIFEEREVLGKEFRIYGTPDEPLFLAKDVAEWIEHSNSSAMLQSIDEDEKRLIKMGTLNNAYSALFLTEDGLYEVLMQSRKPIAKQFKAEVKNILKTIRKHGGYLTPDKVKEALMNPDTLIQLATQLKTEQEERAKADRLNFQLERELDVLEEANSVIRIGDLVHEIRKATGSLVRVSTVYEWMRSNGYIFNGSSGHVPTEKSIKNGWMIERNSPCLDKNGTLTYSRLAMITVAGQKHFIDQWKSYKTLPLRSGYVG